MSLREELAAEVAALRELLRQPGAAEPLLSVIGFLATMTGASSAGSVALLPDGREVFVSREAALALHQAGARKVAQ